jgi:brefeldin A-inhibited guanine nucleotide-exchange protein
MSFIVFFFVNVQVFTAAAADGTKSTVLVAFGTMERIVRDYFRYITETDATTFTDCVHCLIAFTSSQFNSEASLNAIAFLRFCAVKLAEEGFVCQDRLSTDMLDGNATLNKNDSVSFWVPLLAGTALVSYLQKASYFYPAV